MFYYQNQIFFSKIKNIIGKKKGLNLVKNFMRKVWPVHGTIIIIDWLHTLSVVSGMKYELLELE